MVYSDIYTPKVQLNFVNYGLKITNKLLATSFIKHKKDTMQEICTKKRRMKDRKRKGKGARQIKRDKGR